MPDRRAVDDLTIEELERILILKKRQARLDRLERYEQVGRRRADQPPGGAEDAPGDDTSQLPYHSYLHDERFAKESRLRDRLLLAIELAAALGLVAVLVFAVMTVRDINRDAQAAQAAEVAQFPTATPTAVLTTVVLPGGHTPPTDPEGAQPNYDEVPARLRPLVEQQFQIPISSGTPAPGQAVRIRIPALGVDAAVVQGDGWEQLKRGVGQHIGSANPGQPGNVVLSAHDDIYGELFRHLDELEEGDEIILHTQTREVIYRVLYWRIVPPTEVSVMEPTSDPIVTLISCYPYLVNSDRIVVVGELVE
jgi:sortase A